MHNNFDDFDTEIGPEELFNEDIMDDNPIDSDFEPSEYCGEFPDDELDFDNLDF